VTENMGFFGFSPLPPPWNMWGKPGWNEVLASKVSLTHPGVLESLGGLVLRFGKRLPVIQALRYGSDDRFRSAIAKLHFSRMPTGKRGRPPADPFLMDLVLIKAWLLQAANEDGRSRKSRLSEDSVERAIAYIKSCLPDKTMTSWTARTVFNRASEHERQLLRLYLRI
jgi:hypothetical protein